MAVVRRGADRPDPPVGIDVTVWDGLLDAWDQAPVLVSVLVGADHRLAYANAAVEKLFGGRRLGVPLRDAFPGMDLSALAFFDEVWRTGHTVQVPVRRVAIRDLSGGDVVMRYVLSPLAAADGEVVGVVSHAADVTAEARMERSSQRSELLADITDRMNATDQPGDALQVLSSGLVPLVADVAAVFVVVPDQEQSEDSGEPVAMTLSEGLQALGAPPARQNSTEPSPYLPGLQSGEAMVVDVDEDSLPTLAPDPLMRDWLTRAAITSLAMVPLVVAGSLIGAVVLATAGDRPPYDGSDVPFLEDIAARAGAAISHARTLRRSHEVAVDLQRALLPASPPAFTDREVAGRYLAGVPDVEVGGDWWDIVDMGAGQTALGVGDVSGRGVPAAVVMGQARAAMRATSFAQMDPLDVLGVLDQQLAELVTPRSRESFAPPRFVTALYGVFEPRTATLRFACAGHPPPVVRMPDGTAYVADVRPGTPLGLQMGGWSEVCLPFPAGATVAMFTDGLVESRTQDVDEGLADLATALRNHGGGSDLDDVAGELISAMARDQGHVDDVALLLMRTSKDAYPRASLDLTVREFSELTEARRGGSALLRRHGIDPDICSDAQHVLDELVANALEHASPAELHLHVTGVRVVIEVTDQAVGRPRPREATQLDERGRGLAVTAGLSSRWGVRTSPRGKTVWAEIMLRPS